MTGGKLFGKGQVLYEGKKLLLLGIHCKTEMDMTGLKKSPKLTHVVKNLNF